MATRLSTAERIRVYGRPGHVPVKNVKHLIPWEINQSIWVHLLIVDAFLDACAEAARESSWIPHRCDSYVVRPIRGSSDWSLHSFAIAHDWFATGPTVPPPGGVWNPTDGVPQAFAWCFQRRGFTWGATFNRVDTPHIELAGYPPGGGTLPDPTPSPPSSSEFPMALSPTEQREMRDKIREIHMVLFSGKSPRPEVDPAICQAMESASKIDDSMHKGAAAFGVPPVVEATTRTLFSVQGVDLGEDGEDLRTFIREVTAD